MIVQCERDQKEQEENIVWYKVLYRSFLELLMMKPRKFQKAGALSLMRFLQSKSDTCYHDTRHFNVISDNFIVLEGQGTRL
jgi:hypothetical protein